MTPGQHLWRSRVTTSTILIALALTSCAETTSDNPNAAPAGQSPPALTPTLPQTEATPDSTPTASSSAIDAEFHPVSERGWKYQVSMQVSTPEPGLNLGDPGEAEATVTWTGTVKVANATPSRPKAPVAGNPGSSFSIILYWKLPPNLRKEIGTTDKAIGSRALSGLIPEETSGDGEFITIDNNPSGFATMKEEVAKELSKVLGGPPDAAVLTAEESMMAGATDPSAAGECGISAFGPNSIVVGAVDRSGKPLSGKQLMAILGGANVPGSALAIDCST